MMIISIFKTSYTSLQVIAWSIIDNLDKQVALLCQTSFFGEIKKLNNTIHAITIINFINKIQNYQKHKDMFSLNNSFYVPMYWIPQQASFYPPIFNVFPQTNFYQPYQLTVNPKENLHPLIQNERVNVNQTQVPYIQLQKNNSKEIKRISKNKNIQKQVPTNYKCQDQIEKLNRKLANRPKTYQTQKKMYLNQKLQKQQEENPRRRLRQRKPLRHMKSKKQRQDKQNNQSKHEGNEKIICQKLKKCYKDKNQNQQDSAQNFEISLNIAVVPMNQKESGLCFEAKMQKKMDLLSRKFQSY